MASFPLTAVLTDLFTLSSELIPQHYYFNGFTFKELQRPDFISFNKRKARILHLGSVD